MYGWTPPLVLSCLLWLGGCEGPPEPQTPEVMRRLAPPITDVAMLRLQPDGSYRRVCGAPGPAVRAMMDGLTVPRRAPE